MFMMRQVLTAIVLVGNGIAAGVLFAHAVSVWPALQAMTPNRYVEAHKLIGRASDPMMPIIVSTSMVLDIVLTVLQNGPPKFIFMMSAVSLFGVVIVSQICNVPLNRQTKALDPEAIPPDWKDPRGEWAKWNRVRTALSILALIGNAVGAVIVF
jgi:uncharacterized membrane protein